MFVKCGPAQFNCGETVNFASRASKSVALGKAAKNRENVREGKSGKASTAMAAANKLGNGEGGAVPGSARKEDWRQEALSRGPHVCRPSGGDDD